MSPTQVGEKFTSSEKFAPERQIWAKDEAWKWKDLQNYSAPPANLDQWQIFKISQIWTNGKFLGFLKLGVLNNSTAQILLKEGNL